MFEKETGNYPVLTKYCTMIAQCILWQSKNAFEKKISSSNICIQAFIFDLP